MSGQKPTRTLTQNRKKNYCGLNDILVLYVRYGKVNWLFNVTINGISVIYVTAHRCAGGLKKK